MRPAALLVAAIAAAAAAAAAAGAALSWWAHLDVVEVDFSQAAVVVVDSLQSFLHVGGVRRLVREDLERIWFHHTCPKHNRSSRSLSDVLIPVVLLTFNFKFLEVTSYVLLMPSVLAMVPVVPRAS